MESMSQIGQLFSWQPYRQLIRSFSNSLVSPSQYNLFRYCTQLPWIGQFPLPSSQISSLSSPVISSRGQPNQLGSMMLPNWICFLVEKQSSGQCLLALQLNLLLSFYSNQNRLQWWILGLGVWRWGGFIDIWVGFGDLRIILLYLKVFYYFYGLIIHRYNSIVYLMQKQPTNIEEQKQIQQIAKEQEYDQKIKRLLQRWSQTKYQITRCKKQRTISQKTHQKQSQHLTPQYVIQTKKTPVFGKFQVVVVGGGPAGLSAAIAASRAGAQTLIIERYGCFGGVITTVGMETLGWYRYEGTSDVEGIGRELERVAKRMGSTSKWAFNDSECLNTQQFKMIADQLIIENNIKPLLHTYVVDSIVQNGTIKGIIVQSKSGRQAIYGQRIIDCSGDADVAYFSGCRYTSLPLEKSLGVTSVFNVVGVDKDKFLEYVNKDPQTYKDWNTGTWQQDTTGKEDTLKSPYFGRQFQKAQSQGLLEKQNQKNLDITGSWSALSNEGEATNLNLVHMTGYDVLNNEDLTKAEMQGRKGTVKALNALRKLVPGFQNSKLRNFAMTLGVRDSRKIVGQYDLTGNDVCMQARFQDSVGVFPQFVDGYSILILPSTGRYFQIPYGCLVPDVDNLLVAGRCVSGDMVSHAATRNMMCCTVTGQAAGVAAAISLKLGVSTKNINVKQIQSELKRQGARIQ